MVSWIDMLCIMINQWTRKMFFISCARSSFYGQRYEQLLLLAWVHVLSMDHYIKRLVEVRILWLTNRRNGLQLKQYCSLSSIWMYEKVFTTGNGVPYSCYSEDLCYFMKSYLVTFPWRLYLYTLVLPGAINLGEKVETCCPQCTSV